MDFRKPIAAAGFSVHDRLVHSLPLGIVCARSVKGVGGGCAIDQLPRGWNASRHTEIWDHNGDTARRCARTSLGIRCTCCLRQRASRGAMVPDRNMHLVMLKPSIKNSVLWNIALMLINWLSLNIAQQPPQFLKPWCLFLQHIASVTQRRLLETFQTFTLLSTSCQSHSCKCLLQHRFPV